MMKKIRETLSQLEKLSKALSIGAEAAEKIINLFKD